MNVFCFCEFFRLIPLSCRYPLTHCYFELYLITFAVSPKWNEEVAFLFLIRVSVLAINRPGRYQMGAALHPGPVSFIAANEAFLLPPDTQRVRAQGQPSLDFAVSANFGNWSKQGLEFILETERPLESIFTGRKRNKPSKIDSANTILWFIGSSKSNQSIHELMNRWTLTCIDMSEVLRKCYVICWSL